MGIERFLGLSEEEINRRIEEEKRRIPTTPGTEYLKLRFKRFETPELGLIIYLAYNSPALLMQALNQYSNYDGNEARAAIIEDLKEYYILGKLLLEYQRKNTKKK